MKNRRRLAKKILKFNYSITIDVSSGVCVYVSFLLSLILNFLIFSFFFPKK